jgi:hypothetical protein
VLLPMPPQTAVISICTAVRTPDLTEFENATEETRGARGSVVG